MGMAAILMCHMEPNLTLCLKRSKVNLGSSFGTNLVVLECLMLYTKFQRSRSFGSEDDFQRFLLYGYGGHLGHVTRIIWTNFRSPVSRGIYMKFDFD